MKTDGTQLDSLNAAYLWLNGLDVRSVYNEQDAQPIYNGSHKVQMCNEVGNVVAQQDSSPVNQNKTQVIARKVDQNLDINGGINQTDGNESFIVIAVGGEKKANVSPEGGVYLGHEIRTVYDLTATLAGQQPMSLGTVQAMAEEFKHSLDLHGIQNDEGSLDPLNTTEITDEATTWSGYFLSVINLAAMPFSSVSGYFTSDKAQD